jgi:ribosomal protein S18 acetylase RimI-like enzyme
MPNIELRDATGEDRDFAYDVLRASMREYVAQVWGWDEDFQQARFKRSFDPRRVQIIVCDGEDAGVFTAYPEGDAVMLSQIYILPQYQNRGIGTQLIRSLLESVHADGKPVSLRALKVNPVHRLYERLGFELVKEDETYYYMTCAAPCQESGQP